MSIGNRLMTARGDESRRSVCDAVGISLSALQMYENDKRVPRDPVKVRLAEHYHTTVQALFYPQYVTKSDESN